MVEGYEAYYQLTNVVDDKSAADFLTNPDLLKTDAELTWVSAIRRYITPVNGKPSAQQLINGLWEPQQVELDQGIDHGFGAALKLFWGDKICGFNSRKAQAAVDFYFGAL